MIQLKHSTTAFLGNTELAECCTEKGLREISDLFRSVGYGLAHRTKRKVVTVVIFIYKPEF